MACDGGGRPDRTVSAQPAGIAQSRTVPWAGRRLIGRFEPSPAQTADSVALVSLCLVLIAANKPLLPLTGAKRGLVGLLAALEIGLLVQAVVGVVQMLGLDREIDRLPFVGYLAGPPLILPSPSCDRQRNAPDGARVCWRPFGIYLATALCRRAVSYALLGLTATRRYPMWTVLRRTDRAGGGAPPRFTRAARRCRATCSVGQHVRVPVLVRTGRGDRLALRGVASRAAAAIAVRTPATGPVVPRGQSTLLRGRSGAARLAVVLDRDPRSGGPGGERRLLAVQRHQRPGSTLVECSLCCSTSSTSTSWCPACTPTPERTKDEELR